MRNRIPSISFKNPKKLRTFHLWLFSFQIQYKVNKYLPIFVEQDNNSIIANDINIKNIILESIKLNLTPIFIYGNEHIGIPKNILNLRTKFNYSYTLELIQMGALQSYNVSNCLSILSYKVMEVFSNLK